MEKTLETGESKIQKICDALKKETLEPAKQQADQILEDAKRQKEQIIKEAKEEAKKHIEEARKEIAKENSVFHSSLEQASKQAVEKLKQVIEQELFTNELQKLVEEGTKDPKLIANLIEAIVNAVNREGTTTELEAVIPQAVSAKEVNRLLGDEILQKLKKRNVTLGPFAGGAEVKLLDKKMTLVITDQTLKECLANYVRKDFREYIFR